MEFSQDELKVLIQIVSRVTVPQTVDGKGDQDLAMLRSIMGKRESDPEDTKPDRAATLLPPAAVLFGTRPKRTRRGRTNLRNGKLLKLRTGSKKPTESQSSGARFVGLAV